MATDEKFFPYEIDKRWAPLLLPLGVGKSDGVTISDDHLVATFGWVKVRTPLSNVDHTEVTGPHRWYTAVGLRMSFADDGITFGTNHHKALCIGFVEPIPRVVGFHTHSALSVSVADPAGLAAAIRR